MGTPFRTEGVSEDVPTVHIVLMLSGFFPWDNLNGKLLTHRATWVYAELMKSGRVLDKKRFNTRISKRLCQCWPNGKWIIDPLSAGTNRVHTIVWTCEGLLPIAGVKSLLDFQLFAFSTKVRIVKSEAILGSFKTDTKCRCFLRFMS